MANVSTSKTAFAPTVSGLFPDRDAAERAYQRLIDLGYTRDEINVLMSEDTRNRYFNNERSTDTELGNKAAEGAGIGGGIGAAIGALFGAIATIGTSVLIPGLGLIVAGPFAAALAGAGAGGVAGGLIGALIGAGIPEERARAYEQGIKRGEIFISVHAHSSNDADQIERAWQPLGDVDLRR